MAKTVEEGLGASEDEILAKGWSKEVDFKGWFLQSQHFIINDASFRITN